MGASILVSAMNSIAKQGPESLLLCFYLKMNKKGPKPILLVSPVHMAKLICEVLSPSPPPPPNLGFLLVSKLGYEKTALKFEYSD